MTTKTKAISVKGRVQGVGLRYFVLRNAQRLGIKGFVKNMPDRSVYIEAQGQEENLNELIGLCWKGPGRARVDSVETIEVERDKWNDFYVE
jgi:acylphosphatase